MARKKTFIGLVLAVSVLFGTLSALTFGPLAMNQARSVAAADGDVWEFALIGDTRYTDEQKGKFPNLIADINKHTQLMFTVHDGDIKGGSDACLDSIYHDTKTLFNQFQAPLIFTPGDNDWTDCHRAGGPTGNSIERLNFERSLFFGDAFSMGVRKMGQQRQPGYPENARWSMNRIMFATLNIQGSNNNLARNGEQDAEYIARNVANLNWMTQTFDLAKANGSIAVMIIVQANMWDNIPVSQLEGFKDTKLQLERDVINFGKPVVWVNGDSHYFRIDKPIVGVKSQRRLENFTRVETFGTDDVHWVRVTVDPSDPNIFTFRQMIVTANKVNQVVP